MNRRVAVQGKGLPKAVCAAHLDQDRGKGQCLRLSFFGDITAILTSSQNEPTVIRSPELQNQVSNALTREECAVFFTI